MSIGQIAAVSLADPGMVVASPATGSAPSEVTPVSMFTQVLKGVMRSEGDNSATSDAGNKEEVALTTDAPVNDAIGLTLVSQAVIPPLFQPAPTEAGKSELPGTAPEMTVAVSDVSVLPGYSQNVKQGQETIGMQPLAGKQLQETAQKIATVEVSPMPQVAGQVNAQNVLPSEAKRQPASDVPHMTQNLETVGMQVPTGKYVRETAQKIATVEASPMPQNAVQPQMSPVEHREQMLVNQPQKVSQQQGADVEPVHLEAVSPKVAEQVNTQKVSSPQQSSPAVQGVQPSAVVAVERPVESSSPKVSSGASESTQAERPSRADVVAQRVREAFLGQGVTVSTPGEDASPTATGIQSTLPAHREEADTTASVSPAIAAPRPVTAENSASQNVISGMQSADTGQVDSGADRRAAQPLLSVQRPGDGLARSSQVAGMQKTERTVPAQESSQAAQPAATDSRPAAVAATETEFSSEQNANEEHLPGGSQKAVNLQELPHTMHAKAAPVVHEVQQTASAAGESPLPELAKKVAVQVETALAGRPAPSTVDQITIKLSPGHLGDLRMSFKMEDQRLKVEIITESRQVRDAIMQHSDSLRDALARQNIMMDSFDVSTGSRWSNSAGQGQQGWNELARQRQMAAWMPAGYRQQADSSVPLPQVYQQTAQYGMVDLHF